MRKYKILCLTDHKGHSKENSLYAILNGLRKHSLTALVTVASRGSVKNNLFFNEQIFDSVYGVDVDENFSYKVDGSQFLDSKEINPHDYDVVFMRLPRPVTDQFLLKLKSTFSKQVFINDPAGIIECSSKKFLLNFPDQCPPIKLCKSIDEVVEFAKAQDIVLKPLKEYGGKGLLKITGKILNDGSEDHDVMSYLPLIKKELEEDGYLAMKYLKNVSQGDKRLIVVGGKILAASLRLPPEDSWLCNVAVGGTSVPSSADEDEMAIVDAVCPTLIKKGILICGIDTLVDDDGKRVLSEINALSIGGFPQAEKQTGLPIIEMTVNKMFEYVEQCA